MDKIDNAVLLNLLKNDGTCVYATESTTMEFKSDFAWADRAQRAKYCKSMAAMCNNEGGYLLFGIEDATGKILGVNNFDAVDSADISDHLNNYFSPAFNFHKVSIEVTGHRVGIIYIERYKDIPAICIKAYETILKDGALFYRYPGKSDFISGTDLISLLHGLKNGRVQELASLEKLKMKQNARPILQRRMSGSEQTSFNHIIENFGNRARIYDIKISAGNYNLLNLELPKVLEKGESFKIIGINADGVISYMAPYEIEIHYADLYNNRYLLKLAGRGADVKLLEPIEI